MKRSAILVSQFILGSVLGSVIACAPTRFNPSITKDTLCNDPTSTCIQGNNSIDVTQTFKVGTGKVDILFINDISASMSKVQAQMAARFAGFIENLNRKEIDYRIAISTTDYKNQSGQTAFVGFSNGQTFLNRNSSNSEGLFNEAIASRKTVECEDFIVSMFNTYGPSFQNNSYYQSNYNTKCPSAQTSLLRTASNVVTSQGAMFLRNDANFNIIAISNDDTKLKESIDLASSFTSMMTTQYANKYWDFHSIVVKDQVCAQNQSLRNAQGTVITNITGTAAVAGAVGYEYAALSMSAAKDIDGNARPRGQVLDICQSDYAQHFYNISTQIAESARMMNLKCIPKSAPTVTFNNGTQVAHTWSADKITFPRGTEGQSMIVKYSCAQVN